MSIIELTTLMVDQSKSLQPFAISLTKDKETAKDLCQETIYRALSNIEKYQMDTNLKSWLYTIMRNIFINDYRKSKRQPSASADELVVSNNMWHAASNMALSIIETKEIEQAVYLLPAIFRSAFVLYVQGYKYHEIAEILNEPLGTIKSRIHFARKTLKEQINKN
jgi:RNA polymerase sigma factor (sigma-70 family)